MPQKILIFDGILTCQISCDTLTPLLINAAYIDLTEKVPDELSVQRNLSLSPCKFISCREATILCQSLKFLSTKFRRKEIFKGTVARTVATESCFLLAILNNAGNLSFNGLLPNQVSNQKRIWDPSNTLKVLEICA